MMSSEAWNKITTARIPLASLKSLAHLRHRSDITVSLDDHGNAWIHWLQSAIAEEVMLALRPLTDVSFYYREANTWYTRGSGFPAKITPPNQPGLALAKLLFPEKMTSQSPENKAFARITPVLSRGGQTCPASAMRLPFASLHAWVNHATSAQIHALHGVYEADQVWLLGQHLPAASQGMRFYGERLLLPLGYQLQPMLPVESSLALVNASERDVVFWSHDEIRVIPREEFAPLTRAGVRQVCRKTGASA
jgi:hypothetical protein